MGSCRGSYCYFSIWSILLEPKLSHSERTERYLTPEPHPEPPCPFSPPPVETERTPGAGGCVQQRSCTCARVHLRNLYLLSCNRELSEEIQIRPSLAARTGESFSESVVSCIRLSCPAVSATRRRLRALPSVCTRFSRSITDRHSNLTFADLMGTSDPQ